MEENDTMLQKGHKERVWRWFKLFKPQFPTCNELDTHIIGCCMGWIIWYAKSLGHSRTFCFSFFNLSIQIFSFKLRRNMGNTLELKKVLLEKLSEKLLGNIVFFLSYQYSCMLEWIHRSMNPCIYESIDSWIPFVVFKEKMLIL